MNRRKVISYIIGLCGAGALPTVVQALPKSKQIDYERYGRLFVEESLAYDIYRNSEMNIDSREYKVWEKLNDKMIFSRNEIRGTL